MSTRKDSLLLTPVKQRQISELLHREFSFAWRTAGAFGAHIAASIYRDGMMLGCGENSEKTHPFQKKYGRHEDAIHLHAEIDAIIQASRNFNFRDLQGSVMVVARAKRSGPSQPFVYGMAKPCVGCQRAIAAAGIKEVYFTCDGDMEWDSL